MSNRDLLLMASILALLRGEMTARGVAERFGVTEAQVARWRDIFEIAGMLALSNVLSGQSRGPRTQRRPGGAAQGPDPTTPCFGDPTTTPRFGDPTTRSLYTTTPPVDDTTSQKRVTTAPKHQSGGKAGSRSKVKKRNKRAKSKSKR
jgi:Helix-turn-helix domain